MKAWLRAAWLHLVWEEKKLFKSSTMWLAFGLANAPTVLQWAQDNWPSIAPYLPHVLQAKGLGWVAAAIALCRLRSMLPVKAPQSCQ